MTWKDNDKPVHSMGEPALPTHAMRQDPGQCSLGPAWAKKESSSTVHPGYLLSAKAGKPESRYVHVQNNRRSGDVNDDDDDDDQLPILPFHQQQGLI
jgi:hypothetical protein